VLYGPFPLDSIPEEKIQENVRRHSREVRDKDNCPKFRTRVDFC
jgi:hypothetical protein